MANKVNFTWQRIVSVVFGLPIVFIGLLYYFDDDLSESSIFDGIGLVVASMCALLGALCGMMFNDPDEKFSKNILARIVSGFVSGVIYFWSFGFYLWIRNYPSSIRKVEIVIPIVFACLIGLLLYKLICKK